MQSEKENAIESEMNNQNNMIFNSQDSLFGDLTQEVIDAAVQCNNNQVEVKSSDKKVTLVQEKSQRKVDKLPVNPVKFPTDMDESDGRREEDVRLTAQSDDDDFDFDSSCIIMENKSEKNELKKTDSKKNARKAEPAKKSMKRTIFIKGGYPRLNKRRRAELDQAQKAAADTQERSAVTEKLMNGYQKEYDRGLKSRQAKKLKLGDEIHSVQIDNPKEPRFHTNLDKRIEIKPKLKPNSDTDEVRQLKEQVTEYQRQLKETQLHNSRLQSQVEELKKTVFRLQKDKDDLAQVKILLQHREDKIAEQGKIIWNLLKEKEEFNRDKQQTEVHMEDKAQQSEVQIQPAVEMVDKEIQCQKQHQVQMDGGTVSYNSCTVNQHHVHHHYHYN